MYSPQSRYGLLCSSSVAATQRRGLGLRVRGASSPIVGGISKALRWLNPPQRRNRFTVTCNKIQLTLSQDRCVAVFRVVVAGRYLACVSIQLTLSQEIFTGVLIHRVTRPLRGSVSCGSGWSVPCVSIQLTLSQPLRGSVSCGSGWSVPCVSIQLTLSQRKPTPRGWRIGGVVHV